MSNRIELRDARRKAAEAAYSAEQIERLPRHRGDRVEWANGVIWTRAGDDDWRPDSGPDLRYSSAHVASSLGWKRTGRKPTDSRPPVLEDGTLGLGCGSLWSGADYTAWRENHLPACAICIGTYGDPELTDSATGARP